MEVRTGQALEKWYREAELSVLGPMTVRDIDWHGGEFSSREGGGYWDTKTLVGRDNRGGDDETLGGGDD